MKKSKKKATKWLAEYMCCSCKFKYNSRPGPTMCPKCGNVYVLWMNYNKHWEDLDIKKRV